jgi:hypothetical protein
VQIKKLKKIGRGGKNLLVAFGVNIGLPLEKQLYHFESAF